MRQETVDILAMLIACGKEQDIPIVHSLVVPGEYIVHTGEGINPESILFRCSIDVYQRFQSLIEEIERNMPPIPSCNSISDNV